MSKFQRAFKLVYTVPPTTTEPDAEVIEISSPLTVEFDITRNTFAQSNTATFRLHNLAPSTRDKIFQDRYNIFRYCFVDFYAGYGDQLSLLFTGKVLQAYSEKQGTEIITEIQAMDNDIIQSYSLHTFEAGTSKTDVIKTLASDMPNTQLNAVGNQGGVLANRLIVDDLTFVAINKVTGNSAFIDMGKLNVLNNNEVLKDVEIYKIDSDTGLLGTPKRRDAQVEVDLIFEPRITVGQLVEIESSTASIFDGQFKVIGIHHTGTISGAIAGEARTTLNLFIGPLIPNSNQIFTGVGVSEPLSEVKGVGNVVPVNKEVLSSIREVRAYLIKYNRVPDKKITHGIKWANVLLNYSKQGSVPSLDVLVNLYQVATQLQNFVDKFYPGNKIVINSGWRSQSYNATIPGAAPRSAHILGKALDFSIPGQTLYYVYQNVRKYWSGWFYMGNGFIHVNTPRGGGKVANDR